MHHSGSGLNSQKIPPGEYEYPFECDLPIDLPSSIETRYGHIRYILNLIIDIPHGQAIISDHVFTVIKHLDLNESPQLRVR